jgi:DNA-binding response OmpR family regulator
MKTVLLVDDDPVFSDLAAGFLASRGYDVASVPTTTAALDVLESARRIDLAVVDIMMPPGHPHGVALAAMVRLRRIGCPVILVTGARDEVQRYVTDELAIVDKPVDLEALHVAIKAQLGE